MLAGIIPQCSALQAPLDTVITGRQSHERINLSDDLLFHNAQSAHLLHQPPPPTPCLDNQLWIITNGAVKSPGITTTMYIIRDNTLQLTSLSSTKLWSCQVTWLPCEIEALSIPAAMKHYSSYSWKHQPAFSLTIKHVCGHLKSSVVVSFPQTLVLPPSFPPSVGAKPLFIMLLEPLSYHLTLPVAMPVSATTQLAKFAASSNTPRILWFSVHLSKAY